jgi:hypothetical protein
MRAFVILVAAVLPAIAQTPIVLLTNPARPASREFQIGDRYQIAITAAPGQPVSVRTTMHGRTDWSPVIGATDSSGHWSTSGQFAKADFGGWSEVWTVGGKLAAPALEFSVSAPCVKGGPAFAGGSGPNQFVTCDTAAGRQTFVTPSDSDPFRTPDGRMVPGRMQSNMTPEQYHAQIIESLILSRAQDVAAGRLGDEAGDAILKMIGVNALSDDEIRQALSIVRAAFEHPESIPQTARDPSRTLLLLRTLLAFTSQEALQQQIAATAAYIQSR